MVSANLKYANLSASGLTAADLTLADLREANLSHAELQLAKLTRANLTGAILYEGMLRKSNLYAANLTNASLRGVRLSNADLSSADLRGTDLSGADCGDVRLYKVTCGGTLFGSLDLSEAAGLGTIYHVSPSSLGTDTLVKSKGRIDGAFLKGCGLFDWEIEAAKLYDRNLRPDEIAELLNTVHQLRAGSPIQICPIFVSYSHKDGKFVDELEARLNASRIRFWRDVNDLTVGRVEKQLERAISLNPTVLLILSGNSVDSDWVEWEAGKAREIEKQLGRDVLCPIALDEAWKVCKWSGPLRRQIEKYHVLDFSDWHDSGAFDVKFTRILQGLRLFY